MPTALLSLIRFMKRKDIVGNISARQDKTIRDTGVKGTSGTNAFGERGTVLSQGTWVISVSVPL